MTSAGLMVHWHALGTNRMDSPRVEGVADRVRSDDGASAAAEGAGAPPERAIAFGPFHLLPARRLLLQGDQPVRLGSRALEILIALVERPGGLLTKAELMARVWPNTFVEEGNLKVQVGGLRRALGDSRGSNRYVATISGRGYSFIAPVTLTDERGPWDARATAEQAHDLPVPIMPMIDRADAVAALMTQLTRQRLVTIVGPGGIGKTTVALAIARRLSEAYEHGVRFADLASAVEPYLVPRALAAALGVEIGIEDPISGLIKALREKRMLLVLDNCEHVIEASAVWAAEFLSGAPGVRILATSREPLRAEGEQVHRLAPLESPLPSARLTAAEALSFPAVQLFVERAAASSGDFELSDQDASIVADICRRLDGIPLAIELAAARVNALGVRGVAAHLDDRLQLLSDGRRPAPSRQRSLRATLDWGHELLASSERVVLRRLAVFANGFTLEAASVIAASADVAAAQVVECVANLVTKSLIVAELEGAVPCYRLFETTRAYALEKLSASGELEQVARRHAEYAQKRGRRTDAKRDMAPAAERLARCGRRIDDTGARWGDPSSGAAFAAHSLPGSFHL